MYDYIRQALRQCNETERAILQYLNSTACARPYYVVAERVEKPSEKIKTILNKLCEKGLVHKRSDNSMYWTTHLIVQLSKEVGI